MDKYPWVRITTDKYKNFEIEKGAELRTFQTYESGCVEVGSIYGLIMINPWEYELIG